MYFSWPMGLQDGNGPGVAPPRSYALKSDVHHVVLLTTSQFPVLSTVFRSWFPGCGCRCRRAIPCAKGVWQGKSHAVSLVGGPRRPWEPSCLDVALQAGWALVETIRQAQPRVSRKRGKDDASRVGVVCRRLGRSDFSIQDPRKGIIEPQGHRPRHSPGRTEWLALACRTCPIRSQSDRGHEMR